MTIDAALSARLAADARVQLVRLPLELRARARWVRYRLSLPDARGKRSKVPWDAHGDRPGSSTDAATWGSFAVALEAVGRHGTAGLGYVFAAGDGLVGIDLDGVVQAPSEPTALPDLDAIEPAALAIVRDCGSYAEYSLSRTGIHIYLRGALPDGRGRKCARGYEVYERGRYFTVTGWQIPGTPACVAEGQAALEALLATWFAGPSRTPASPLPPRAVPAPPLREPAGGGARSQRLTPLERARRYLARVPGAVSGQGGHDQTWQAALALVGGFDLAPAEALALLLAEYNPRCVPPWSEAELRHKVADAARARVARGYLLTDGGGAGRAALGGTPPEGSGAAPPPAAAVLVPGQHVDAGGELHEVGVSRFGAAVYAELPPGATYRRGDELGELVGPPGQRVFRAAGHHRLRAIVDQHVRLIAWRVKRTPEGPVRQEQFVPCSSDHGQVLRDYGRIDPTVRELRMLTSYPVFLGPACEPAAPGWNGSAGVYYDAPPDLGALRDDLDHAHCRRVLEDLTVDFPWRDDASRENFYALLLTCLLRPAIAGNVPLFMIQSSLERTGKSKLAEVVAGGIVLGRPTTSRQLGNDESEREKRLAALALKAETLVHLDNLRDYLDSPSIAAAVTSRTLGVRLLGTSQDVEIPNTLVLVVTANNPRATGELAKRMVPICLQPQDDEPERRTNFRHPDLGAYVAAARQEVLSVLVSMVTRWKREGSERWPQLLGGFEDWSGIVGGVLAASGFGAFMGNQAGWARNADPLREDLGTFVAAWWERFNAAAVAIRQLHGLAVELDLFATVLNKPTERGQQTALGGLMRRLVDRPCRGFLIEKHAYGSSNLYRLTRRAEAG